MSVNPGHEAEYTRRHQPIWKELEEVLLAHGVISYSIFMDSETRDLFGYAEIEDEARWAAIANTDVCRRWWRHMREIMPANADDSPVSRELREVFHVNKTGHAAALEGARARADANEPEEPDARPPRRDG